MRPSRKPLLLLLAAWPAFAQPAPPNESPDPDSARERLPDRLPLPLPVLALRSEPGSSFPSWEQAVHLTSDAFLLSHWLVMNQTEGIHNNILRIAVQVAGSLALDFVTIRAIPLGWAHEEGHRDVMARYNIIGHNGVIDPPGSWPPSYRPVYGMTDEQLAAFKLQNNADFVRMQAAGWESELNTNLAIEKATFYYDRPGPQNVFILLLNNASVISYLSACLDQRAMDELYQDEANAVGTNIYLRDFTGPDCTGWAYDLHRPTEPYAARGPHPSGVGIRRDRLPSDLTAEELSYLRRQRNLTLLNFVNPNAFGFSSFSATNPLNGRRFRFNAFLMHQLTSFGSATDLHLLAAQDEVRVGATLHGFTNGQMLFPGLSAEIERFPFYLLGGTFHLTGVVSLWLQPKEQAFKTSEMAPGAMASVTVAKRIFDAFDVTLRVRGKTAGWVPVYASTDPAGDATLGVNVLLP